MIKSRALVLPVLCGFLFVSCMNRDKKTKVKVPEVAGDTDKDGQPDVQGDPKVDDKAKVETAANEAQLKVIAEAKVVGDASTPAPKSIIGRWELSNFGSENSRFFWTFSKTEVMQTMVCYDPTVNQYFSAAAKSPATVTESAVEIKQSASKAAKAKNGNLTCNSNFEKGTYSYSIGENGELLFKYKNVDWVMKPSMATGAISSTWQEVSAASDSKIFWTFSEKEVNKRTECNLAGKVLAATATSGASFDATGGVIRVLAASQDRKFEGEESCLSEIEKGTIPYFSGRESAVLKLKSAEAKLKPLYGFYKVNLDKNTGVTHFWNFEEGKVSKTTICIDLNAPITQWATWATATAPAKLTGSELEILETASVTSPRSGSISCTAGFVKGTYSLSYPAGSDAGPVFDYGVVAWSLTKM